MVAATEERAPSRRPVASVWHTILLIAVLLGFSLASAGSQAQFVNRHGRMPIYLLTIGWEWALTAYVIWGIQQRGVRLSELVGGRWRTLHEIALDVAVAAGFWLVSFFVLAGLGQALRLD